MRANLPRAEQCFLDDGGGVDDDLADLAWECKEA